MSIFIWQKCLIKLKKKITSTEFSMWIRPLQAKLNKNILTLYAPNKFIAELVKNKYKKHINLLLKKYFKNKIQIINFKIEKFKKIKKKKQKINKLIVHDKKINKKIKKMNLKYKSNINKKHKFENFIEGQCNKFAKTLIFQITDNLGKKYNPLFLYGSTGVGKTHLLHAIGNKIISKQNDIKVEYIHSEKFVQYMVMALKNKDIDNFKKHYRSVNVLLLDDIQFFANKERSQEEFLYTFNTLLENKQQIIITSDRYPKAIKGVAERLTSRFECGLTIFIEPPEIETRAKIIIKKTEENNIKLSNEIVWFIAQYIKTNVRELEGALNRIIAKANFTKSKITINFVKNVLKDIIVKPNQLITIKNIQKTVAKYYKLNINDMTSKCRIRSITIPRQIAMIITKQLTNHSLPEIGYAFGGRDHSTVLYACRKIKKLCKENYNFKEDIHKIIKKLSS